MDETRSVDTTDGEYRVYRGCAAGMPEAHPDVNAWYYEPAGYDGDVFSDAYTTADEAVEAAHEWASTALNERNAEH